MVTTITTQRHVRGCKFRVTPLLSRRQINKIHRLQRRVEHRPELEWPEDTPTDRQTRSVKVSMAKQRIDLHTHTLVNRNNTRQVWYMGGFVKKGHLVKQLYSFEIDLFRCTCCKTTLIFQYKRTVIHLADYTHK